jgi:DNA (cytosine-5)-methyltransferase 1
VGRPAWVVIENVPGLLSSNGGRDFGVIVSGLVELGYGVCWRVLDSQHFGVPQRRRRVFIIGHLGDDRAGQILLNADSGAWDSAPRRAAGEVAPTLAASGAGTSRVGGQSAEGNFYVPGRWWDGGDLADTLDVSMLVKGQMMPEKRRFPVVMESWQPVVFAADCEGYPDSDLIYCPLCGEEYADCVHPGPTMDGYEYKEFDGVLFARPAHAPPLVSFDWQAGGGGPADQSFRGKGRSYIVRGGDYAQLRANAHDAIAGSSVRPRRLTPVECERLQGFPDGWTAGHADTPRYRMLGNAVTVNVAEWIGRRLLAAE